MNLNRRSCMSTLAALAMLSPWGAYAEALPANVRLIVPWPPGSGGDIAGRLIAAKLGEQLKINVYVENKAGASGSIGAATGSREKPDGSILILGNSASHGSARAVIPNLPYDPVNDFTPISMLYRNGLVLAVGKNFPAKSLPELIEYARKNPVKLGYGTPGVGTPHQLVAEMIQEKTGISMTHVPYKGSAQIITDLVGGHIPIAISAQAAVIENYRAGTIRILAVADKTRSPQLADVPSIAETLPGFDVAGWGGLFAPKGLPSHLVQRYNAGVKAVMESPDLRASMESNGFVPLSSPPEELRSRVKNESERWMVIIARDNSLAGR